MQNTETKKPAPKTKSATKVSTRSSTETAPATKFATAAAIDPQPIHLEQNALEQEHAQAIKRLEKEIEVLKLKTTEIQQSMDQKMKLYVKMQLGAMSLLGMFNIFG